MRNWLDASNFQLALNAAARMIYDLRRSDHVTDALVNVRWLGVAHRIQHKTDVVTYIYGPILGSTVSCRGTLIRVSDQPAREYLQ